MNCCCDKRANNSGIFNELSIVVVLLDSNYFYGPPVYRPDWQFRFKVARDKCDYQCM